MSLNEEMYLEDLEAIILNASDGIPAEFSPLCDQREFLCCSDLPLRYAKKHRCAPERMQAPLESLFAHHLINISWQNGYLYIMAQAKTILRSKKGSVVQPKQIFLPLITPEIQSDDYLRVIALALSLPAPLLPYAVFWLGEERFEGLEWKELWKRALSHALAPSQYETKDRLFRALNDSPSSSIVWMPPKTLNDKDFRDLVCELLPTKQHILRTPEAPLLPGEGNRNLSGLQKNLPREIVLYLGRNIKGFDLDYVVPQSNERDNIVWLGESLRERVKKISISPSDKGYPLHALSQYLALYPRTAEQALTHGKTSEWVMYADSCIYQGVSFINEIRLKGLSHIDKNTSDLLSGIDEVIEDVVQC